MTPESEADARPAWGGVLSMTLGVFALVGAEFLPASLLTPMAADLGISEGMAGQAVTATAHKLARIVYLALKHGMAYVRQSQDDYEAQLKQKQLKALRRKARQLGMELVEKTPGSAATADAASAQG